MGNLLWLLLGVLLPVLALGFAASRGLRPMAAASAYRNVAWRLGLEADTRGTSMRGHLEDRRLFVGEVVDEEDVRRRSVVAILDLATPLGLGLVLRKRDRRRFRRSRAPSLPTGDRKLDERVELRAFEPERAGAVVNGEVRDAVKRLLKLSVDLEITDLWVRVRLRRPPSSEAALRTLVEALRQAVLSLEAARAAVGPSPALDTSAWTDLSDRLGLPLQPSFPALSGTRLDRPVRVCATRTDDGFAAEVSLGFRAHTPTGLMVLARVPSVAAAVVGQDITLGDAAFDAAFVVQAWDPGAVRERLHADARSALLTVASFGEVEVSDRALLVRGVPIEVARLEACVVAAEALAAALDW